MKKYVLLSLCLFLLFIMTGCSNNEDSGEYNGKVTDLSKGYLSKGYAVNIYRSNTPLGEDLESLGKAYVKMDFGILTDYTSTLTYDPDADYNIKKYTVTNVRVISTSKMGIVEDMYILERYSQTINDPSVEVVSTKSKYVIEDKPPHNSGIQSNIMVSLNKIALYDQSKSPSAANGNQPTLKEIYDELGITRDEVALKIGFRVELTTVSNKTLYKDYEITVPPVNTDITSSEFHYEFYETDTSKMEPFLEK